MTASLALTVAPVAQSAGDALTRSALKRVALSSLAHAVSSQVLVPDGTVDHAEPSGEAPPGASAMLGYTQTYVNDFTGAKVPTGWQAHTGTPGSGDPGSQWALNHVVVSNGLLQLNTWRDRAFGDEWVAGGLCQCGVVRTYGAYFVRSKVTGAGLTQVELLWPTTGWPPEIDFNETGGDTSSSMATLHFGSGNHQIHATVNVEMTQWHTWGLSGRPLRFRTR